MERHHTVLWCNWQHVGFWYRRVEVRTLVGQQRKHKRVLNAHRISLLYSLERQAHARVVELVVTLDLGSSIERCVGSSPTLCTGGSSTEEIIGRLVEWRNGRRLVR